MVQGLGGSASFAETGQEDSRAKRSADATVWERRIAKERVRECCDSERVRGRRLDSWLLQCSHGRNVDLGDARAVRLRPLDAQPLQPVSSGRALTILQCQASGPSAERSDVAAAPSSMPFLLLSTGISSWWLSFSSGPACASYNSKISVWRRRQGEPRAQKPHHHREHPH